MDASFYFRNDDLDPIRLPGFIPPVLGEFRPHFVFYEVLMDSGWEQLDVLYDGVPTHFDFDPGESIELQISLGPFETYKVDSKQSVRVRLETFYSDPFTLEQATNK
jgi:hypothetical protein